METEENNKPVEKTPDFVEDPNKIDGFGDKQDKERQQENFPSTGNQSQTGNATGIDDLEIDPSDDGDNSLA
jgi:hypothetical protein